MKSIKEKAEELVEKRVELSREESIAYSQGIEDGANYVLEAVENILQDKNTGLVAMWDDLMTLVEQLRKE